MQACTADYVLTNVTTPKSSQSLELTNSADSAISYIAGERTPNKTPPLLRGCVLLRVYLLP
jgi:hypothetical protein